MIEQELTRIQNEIKALKSSMPVSGSLVETYCITQKSSKVFPVTSGFSYTIKFTPRAGYERVGIVTVSNYLEEWASGPVTSQYNPYSFVSGISSHQNPDGSVTLDYSEGAGYWYDGDTFEVRVTASVYGTIPGTLSIQWH